MSNPHVLVAGDKHIGVSANKVIARIASYSVVQRPVNHAWHKHLNDGNSETGIG